MNKELDKIKDLYKQYQTEVISKTMFIIKAADIVKELDKPTLMLEVCGFVYNPDLKPNAVDDLIFTDADYNYRVNIAINNVLKVMEDKGIVNRMIDILYEIRDNIIKAQKLFISNINTTKFHSELMDYFNK